jgi:poly-beta-1,6-N-acetyl-D-glucosamine synthase
MNLSKLYVTLLLILFWISLGILTYVYFGFPACIWLLTRRKRPSLPAKSADLPSITLVVAALNEEVVLEHKLENCVALDYPTDKLKFFFISDGSTDRTNEILSRWDGPRFQTKLLSSRGGKTRALKLAISRCTGDLIVLSDANTYYRTDALQLLARHFQDRQVGVVTGDVRIRPAPGQFGQGEGAYYRYERWLQKRESDFWTCVGVDGGMYAIRQTLLVLPSDEIILDDFVISMNSARQGYRIIYDPEAVAEEDPTPNDSQEFQRKVRIVAGGYQALRLNEGVPRLTDFRLMWLYLSHKLLRWLAPVFMAVLLGASVGLAGRPLYAAALIGQAALYFLALLCWQFTLKGAVFRLPYYFVLVNLAALQGLFRSVSGKETALWRKPPRVTDSH